MYEELIEALLECRACFHDCACCDNNQKICCGSTDELIDATADAVEILTGRLSAIQSKNAEKDKEIERLRKELAQAHTMETLTGYNQNFLRSEIKRVEAERDDLQATLDMYGGEDGITAAFKAAAERDTYRALGPVEELTALVEARAERRLVVLPCAPSDVTVYQLRSKRHALGVGISVRHISAATVWASGDFILHHQGADGCCEKDFGKTWFLNYAEAEAALPGGSDENVKN